METTQLTTSDFLAKFFIAGLTMEEATDLDVNGVDFDRAFDARQVHIAKKANEASEFIQNNGQEIPVDWFDVVFYKTEPTRREVILSDGTKTVVPSQKDASIFAKATPIGYAQHNNNTQTGVYLWNGSAISFIQGKSTGTIISAWVMALS